MPLGRYFARLWTADLNSKYLFNRGNYIHSFLGWADVVAIFPFYVELILYAAGVQFDAAIFRVARIFRLLQLEHFVTAFTILDDVYHKSKHALAATGMLALVIWVGGATLFYIFDPGPADLRWNDLILSL